MGYYPPTNEPARKAFPWEFEDPFKPDNYKDVWGMFGFLVVIAALAALIAGAYRGHSVILLAPAVAVAAILMTDPASAPLIFSELYMGKLVGFVKLYFPVFILGALFGKLIEISGFSTAVVALILRFIGSHRSIPAIVAVCALLTYGGVSLFVVVFAVYPFAAEIFKQAEIPKRLIPATIALGAFTFTMDALPGTPQIQNIIPTTFFNTTVWATPVLGLVGSVFILSAGLIYLDRVRHKAVVRGEGYGTDLRNEPARPQRTSVGPLRAILPLVVVGATNLALTHAIPAFAPDIIEVHLPELSEPLSAKTSSMLGIWAIEGALLAGIFSIVLLAFASVKATFKEQVQPAIAGALLASLNTASEYGFGAVIAILPGFAIIRTYLSAVPDPLLNEAITVTVLSGVTGSASGGLSIALGAMAQDFINAAQAAGIPLEVLHRVASMASGGMDTLPHNGAIITLLTVTGLTHRQSYSDIFAITCIKTLAVGVVILFYHLTGWY